MKRLFLLCSLMAIIVFMERCGQDQPARSAALQTAPPAAAPSAPVEVTTAPVAAVPPTKTSTPTEPTNAAPQPHKLPPGLVAYVTRENAILYEKPSLKAAQIRTKFKRSETIYILETQMTDEQGREFDIPQWYKIQCENGQQGWMTSRFVGQPF